MKKNKITSIALLLVVSMFMLIACSTTSSNTDSKEVDFPKNSLEGVIAWGAGGVTDSVSRSITPIVENILGESIVMVNKTGGSGAVATQYVHDKTADGYTLLYHAENPQEYKVFGLSDLDYDNFEIISVLAKSSAVVVVGKDSPFNTIDDLLNYAKKNQGKLNFGADGVGSMPFNCAALFSTAENVDFNFVTYDGEGSIITAIIGNQVEASAIGIGSAAQYIKSGDLKPLCIMANEPVDEFPDVPVLGQIKPEYNKSLEAWGAFFAVAVKKGTPTNIVEKLSTAFSEAFKEDRFQEFLKTMGMTPLGLTGQEARNYVDTWREATCWVMHDAGVTEESPEKFGIKRP